MWIKERDGFGFANIKIGILGGIGPEATAEFYKKLIRRIQSSGLVRKNTDFPHIIINSIPAPELIYEKIEEKDLIPYKEGLKELDRFGTDFIVMVCNTIHLYYDEVQKEINTPIIDLREEMRRKLKEKEVKKALILGTSGTVRNGLYRFKGMECIEPDKKEMRQLTDAIFNFNAGKDKEMQKEIVRKICRKYMREGADAVIAACTEFALMLDDGDMEVTNSIDVLVESTIKKLKRDFICSEYHCF